ncbi:MAG: serine/threonine protein kinase [Myxococcales bacterium]|nr:serine/threonine protein kinase [Myxococcales bacterium]
MEGKGKLTKEVVAQEARFILDSILNSGAYPQEVQYEDLRRQCEKSVSLRLLDYVNFLERFGYLTYDRATHLISTTSDGERVVSGEKMAELVIDVVHHFRPILARTRSGKEDSNARARRRGSGSQNAPGGGGTSGGGGGGGGAARIDERYEKLSTLGSGGIGTVYLARQVPLGRDVALKEIRELFGFFTEPQRQEIVRRFDEESRKAAQLSHPNIAMILDGNTSRDYPYLVSEYVSSGSLRRVLKRAEKIPPELSVKVFLQILHGLGHAHQRGVIHRGLKPENILFDRSGNVRITDFGMARVVERDQAVIQHVYVGMGSVAYMAPELFTSPKSLDKRSDLYAVGIIFYEMLARKLPGRRSAMPTELHEGLPKVIDDLFDKLTQDDPEDRYSTVDEVLEDFYKSTESKDYLEPRGAVLFLDNPLDELEMKDEEPEDTPEGGGFDGGGDDDQPVDGAEDVSLEAVHASASSHAEALAAEPGLEVVESSGGTPMEGDDDDFADEGTGSKRGGGRRARSHRPYSFQQRIKEREK